MEITKKEYTNIGETLYSCQLENGLRILVIPKPGFSSFFAVFGTNYGGAMRRFEINGETIDTPAGIAHYLEHKMFDMPDGDNALNMLSANGADANAFTSSGVTCYHFRCTDSFEDNLRLLLHFVSTPYFTEETVEKEQGIIGQEIQMGDDNPGSAIYYNLLGLLFDHHPVKDKVAGTIESIAMITEKTLYDCHSIFYAPSNMVLCVEGDVDPARVCEIAREELSAERRPVPHADFGEKESPLPCGKYSEVSMPVSAPQFLIGAKLLDGTESGAESGLSSLEILRARSIGSLSMKLLFGNSSPFFTRLYAEGTLNHDFDFETDYTAGTGMLMVGGESPDPAKVLEELNAEVARAADGFDEAYFRRTIRSLIGSKLRWLEDFDDVCISVGLGTMEGYCAFDGTEALSNVTQKDCIDWIHEHLAPERLAMAVISPLKD